MSAHDAIAAVPTSASGQPAVKDALHNLLIVRYPYVFGSADDPEAFEAVDAATGSIPLCLVYNGILFALDPDDSTSVHDGTTVLVTADGKRYKSEAVDFDIRAVKDRDLTVPPDEESDPPVALSDSYIVAAGASGDWAAHADEIAVYTARGWVFIAPKNGQLVRVIDEGNYVHWNGSAWAIGVGQSAVGANSIVPSNIVGGRTHWIVVNATTNDPPGSPTTGVAYIIGGSPTGDWAGHAGKIAQWTGSAWNILTPALGWQAYNQALAAGFVYSGAAWVSQAGAIIASGSTGWTDASGGASGGSGSYTYAAGVQATLTPAYLFDGSAVATFATAAGRRVRFHYQAVGNSTRTNGFALFRDNETTAIDTIGYVSRYSSYVNDMFFEITTNDAASHTYYVVQLQISGNAVQAMLRSRLSWDIYA